MDEQDPAARSELLARLAQLRADVERHREFWTANLRSLILLALAALSCVAVLGLGVLLSRRVFAAGQILERENSERRPTDQELRAGERMWQRGEQLRPSLTNPPNPHTGRFGENHEWCTHPRC